MTLDDLDNEPLFAQLCCHGEEPRSTVAAIVLLAKEVRALRLFMQGDSGPEMQYKNLDATHPLSDRINDPEPDKLLDRIISSVRE